MEYTPPPKITSAEVRFENQDSNKNTPPKLEAASQMKGRFVDMLIQRVSAQDDTNKAELARVAELLKSHGKLDNAEIGKEELLQVLNEIKSQIPESVIPKQANGGKLDFSSNIDKEAVRFKKNSDGVANNVLLSVGDDENPTFGIGAADTKNFYGNPVIRSVEHNFPYGRQPFEIIDDNAELGQNAAVFTQQDGSLRSFEGTALKPQDFAVIAQDENDIRQNAIKNITNPDVLSNEQILEQIQKNNVLSAELYNGRALTGEYRTRPEIVPVKLLPFFANQINYEGLDMNKFDKEMLENSEGRIFYISKLSSIGGSSGSNLTAVIKNEITGNNSTVEFNHNGKMAISEEDAETFVKNNPELDKYIKQFFMTEIGVPLSLTQAIKQGLVSFQRTPSEVQEGVYTIGIATIANSSNTATDILNKTNSAPILKSTQAKERQN
jgi:hypothetical protein